MRNRETTTTTITYHSPCALHYDPRLARSSEAHTASPTAPAHQTGIPPPPPPRRRSHRVQLRSRTAAPLGGQSAAAPPRLSIQRRAVATRSGLSHAAPQAVRLLGTRLLIHLIRHNTTVQQPRPRRGRRQKSRRLCLQPTVQVRVSPVGTQRNSAPVGRPPPTSPSTPPSTPALASCTAVWPGQSAAPSQATDSRPARPKPSKTPSAPLRPAP